MKITDAKQLTNGSWYSIIGRNSYVDGGFDICITGEGDYLTVIDACMRLIYILQENEIKKKEV